MFRQLYSMKKQVSFDAEERIFIDNEVYNNIIFIFILSKRYKTISTVVYDFKNYPLPEAGGGGDF